MISLMEGLKKREVFLYLQNEQTLCQLPIIEVLVSRIEDVLLSTGRGAATVFESQ